MDIYIAGGLARIMSWQQEHLSSSNVEKRTTSGAINFHCCAISLLPLFPHCTYRQHLIGHRRSQPVAARARVAHDISHHHTPLPLILKWDILAICTIAKDILYHGKLSHSRVQSLPRTSPLSPHTYWWILISILSHFDIYVYDTKLSWWIDKI